MAPSTLRGTIAIISLCAALLGLVRLETIRLEVSRKNVVIGYSPSTIYRGADTSGHLVIISHGFAGSRQMMENISLSLARAGHIVLAFDYIGHGRHALPLSPDITTLTGTTEDLIQQTLNVVEEAQAITGLSRVSLIGHSMATDVVIRAAARLPQIENVVAISMYSEAVTPDHPKRLLILSGAQETRLREVALRAVKQLGPAVEGKTQSAGDVMRRAVAAPLVGHVGVLWSGLTASETAIWLGTPTQPVQTGLWIALLLIGVVALFWPMAGLLPQAAAQSAPPLKRALLASATPIPVALAVSYVDTPLLGLGGFATLALFLAAWGLVALATLRWLPKGNLRPALLSFTLMILWGLAIFAFSLDRYSAAFLPSGPRLPLMLTLLPATLVFCIADRAMVQGRGLAMRITLRLPFIATLFAAMMLNTASLGMLFTVLPVYILFQIVYGSMAFWAAQRSGPWGPMLASGVILAWAIAASTPLFSAA